MTISNSNGELAVKCNGGCATEITESDIEVEGFQELLVAIQKDGWIIRKLLNSWFHYCPDCLQ